MAGETTTTTASTVPGTTSIASMTPTWYDQLAQQFGGQVSGALSQVQNLTQNWYDQPLTAGLTSQQQDLIGQAPGAAGQWQPQFQQGQGALGQAQQQLTSASTYDPTKMQQHLNPYLGGVLDEIQRRSTQNLMQDVIPGINQSFTGSGLFGSSRQTNKFLPEAIAKSQREMLGAQATAGLQAYDQAAKDYYNWGQLGTQAGQAMGQVGTAMGTQALAGQGQRWQDITNQYQMQEQQRANQQAALDAAYKDWQTQLSTPYNLMGALSQTIPQFSNLYQGAKTTVVAPPSTGDSGIADFLTLLSAINTGTQV